MSISRVREIPLELENDKNREILAYLSHRSCHSDIINNIEKSLSFYSDVKGFCPDGKNFKYVFWYVETTVFACAHGMQNVYLRLAKPQSKSDKVKGTFEGNFSNEHWWSFKYNYVDLEAWVEKSYKYAKNS